MTIRETVHDEDGSECVENSSWDLQSDIYAGSCSHYIIAANLTPGDRVDRIPMEVEMNKWEYVDLILNDTDYKSYGGVTRKANHLRWSQIGYLYPNEVNYTYEMYWDKATGFLLEEKRQGYLIGFEKYYETHPPSMYKLEIVNTNIWEMQEPEQSLWWLAAIPIGVIIVATATVTVKLRNNRKKNEDGKQL